MRIEDQVLETIRVLPGITSKEVIELMPDTNPMTVNFAIRKLEKTRKIEVGSKPNPSHYGRRTIKCFTARTTTPAPAPAPAPQDLTRELAELRAFKARALERFPDLATSDLTFRARQIAAKHVGPDVAELILGGKKDQCPIMLAVTEALEEAD